MKRIPRRIFTEEFKREAIKPGNRARSDSSETRSRIFDARAAAVKYRADLEAIALQLLRDRLPHAAKAHHAELLKRHR